MNLPNKLTLSRVGCAALLILLLTTSFPFSKSLAFAVFIIAGYTDYLDGHLARSKYGVTAFGKFMDPLTDKILVCAAFVSFVELGLVPAWIVVIIITREFMVTGLRLLASTKGVTIVAGRWGKHKMVWQVAAIALFLFGLAIQHDLLRNISAEAAADYQLAFSLIVLTVSIAVAMITVVSGLMYFVEQKEMLKLHIK